MNPLLLAASAVVSAEKIAPLAARLKSVLRLDLPTGAGFWDALGAVANSKPVIMITLASVLKEFVPSDWVDYFDIFSKEAVGQNAQTMTDIWSRIMTMREKAQTRELDATGPLGDKDDELTAKTESVDLVAWMAAQAPLARMGARIMGSEAAFRKLQECIFGVDPQYYAIRDAMKE